MPRAKPKPLPENVGQAFKFTSLPPPIGYLNAKNISASFARSDSQTWWARRDEWERTEAAKRQKLFAKDEESSSEKDKEKENKMDIDDEYDDDSENESDEEESPESKMLVILPGSRWLRIGRASDALPVAVPNVIARKIPPGTKDDDEKKENPEQEQNEEQQEGASGDGLLDSKIEALRTDFKTRMRYLKLRGTTNGTNLAANYNETVKAEIMNPHDDPYAVDWVVPEHGESFYVGENALNIPDRPDNGYKLRWPISRGNLNTTCGYKSIRELMGDIQTIWETTLKEQLEIDPKDLHKYSAILIIPDLYDHTYVREMASMMLGSMNFRQITMQQESLCAAFGAGVSSACVVNIGAETTTVSCIEEGLVLPESRMKLWFGGDDVNDLLYQLLLKINFPYREADMNIRHDRKVIERLKEDIVTLGESDVGLNLYNFLVQKPGQPSAKYAIRTYDEVILAPMCFFATRVIDFDKKQQALSPESIINHNVDDNIDFGANVTTGAMKHSTRHLLPTPAPQPTAPATTSTSTATNTPAIESSVPPTGDDASEAATMSPRQTPVLEDGGTGRVSAVTSQPGTPVPETKPPTRAGSPSQAGTPAKSKQSAAPSAAPTESPASEGIDIPFESSKIPLDVAIISSIAQVGSGNEERAKRILSSLLVIGGSSRIPWTGWGIQSRLSVLLPSIYAQPPAINVVPPPREVDACDLAWKGVSVLGKLDVANDLWVRQSDFEVLGVRAIKDRCFYFAM